MKVLKDIDWRALFLELFGIVFAVLLALWVDQWHDDHELQQVADLQKQRILHEIRVNMQDVFDSNETNMDTYSANKKITQEADWWKDKALVGKLKWSIISADMKDANWQITLVSRAAQRMDVDLLADASNIYKLQGIYEKYLNGMLPRFEDDMVEAGVDPRRALVRQETRFTLLADFSVQLLRADAEFLQKYDGNVAPPVDPAKARFPGKEPELAP